MWEGGHLRDSLDLLPALDSVVEREGDIFLWTDKGENSEVVMHTPVLAVVAPCYNEEEVLPETIVRLGNVVRDLIIRQKISRGSYILFVDDGSKDKTWEIIEREAKTNSLVGGLKLSRNFGHQSALIAGLEFRGINHNQFDMKTNVEDSGVLVLGEESSPYTVFKQRNKADIEVGDLIVITPFGLNYVGPAKREINELLSNYEIVYHAKSILEIPDFSLKALVKYYYRKNLDELIKNSKVMIDDNIFRLPLDFYVLKKIR